MNFEAGRRYSLALMTGVMAAGLAANAPIFAMRLPASAYRARFDRIRLQMNTIAAFTVPVTAGRAIQIIRGHTAAMTGGVAVTDEGQKIFSDATSQFDDNNGGDVRIASTAALTVGTTTYDVQAMRQMTLSTWVPPVLSPIASTSWRRPNTTKSRSLPATCSSCETAERHGRRRHIPTRHRAGLARNRDSELIEDDGGSNR
jgi:hypothetical protein